MRAGSSRRRLISLCIVVLLLLPCLSRAGTPEPQAKDKCPVCGMFVAKYPGWVTSVTFSDGRTVFFDGVKDMFRYHQGLAQYAPKRKQSEISGMRVKDYYSLALLDAASAWYVIGSDVLGPMGKEAIPFAREADARSFVTDHRGTRILRFSGMTAEVVKALE